MTLEMIIIVCFLVFTKYYHAISIWKIRNKSVVIGQHSWPQDNVKKKKKKKNSEWIHHLFLQRETTFATSHSLSL